MSVTSRTIRAGAEGAPVPAVSVVVPARDAEHRIGACVRALARQGLAPADLEVIVVDDGSLDDTAAIAGRFPGVRVLRQGRRGTEAACRAGAGAARGATVAYADPEHPPGEGWLQELVRRGGGPRRRLGLPRLRRRGGSRLRPRGRG